MKAHLFIILTLIFSCCLAKKEYSPPERNKAFKLFQLIEDQMVSYSTYLDKKGILEEPLVLAEYFFKTVKRIAPQFLIDTKSHKDELLTILTDTTFRKNVFTDWDVIYLLYNLPIDDYADLLISVVPLYKNGDIDQYLFELFVFPDICITSSVYKNYGNEKLQAFLNKLLEDENLILKVESENKYFKEQILELKSGTLQREGIELGCGQKINGEVRPSILDTLKVGH